MKSKLFCFLLCSLSLLSHAEGTNKQETDKTVTQSLIQNPSGRESTSLNGLWSYVVDPYENGYYNHRYQPHTDGYFKNDKVKSPSDLIEYNFDTADKINVPGDWNTQKKELYLYEGTVWYHKEFTFQKQSKKRYVVNFGAVNYQAIVYVNGVKVGQHEGGFTSFQFEITDLLKQGDNFITVKADNRRERNQVPTVNTDWWNYGGITREVSILALPKSHLADYTIQVAKDNTNLITGKLTVDGKNEGKVTVVIPELDIKKKIKLSKNGEASFSFKARPTLWSPENPKLYAVEFHYNGEVIKDTIGFRTIETDGEDIKLNGKSVYLRGISIHEESPLTNGRAWSEEDARLLLTWAKELGSNFVRLAHYPHNENMLRVADELGLMVWSEIPVYWTVLFDDENVYNKAELQLTEMISRDKNRASIIMWSMANETPNETARLTFITNLIKKTRSLDDTRLITAAMDTQSNSKNGMVIEDPLASVVDIIGINSYCGWYFAEPETCSDLTWESSYNKPVIMSELGAGALQGKHGESNERWTEEYQASVYKHNLAMVENISSLRGLTPWILKDFRSPRRPLKNIQDFWNRKGLLSETGVKKQAWFILHDFYKKIEEAKK
ncbi:glycoside hydrolase family 2 protein [Pseudocolwellia sp. HL-MZ19]|uniref:glycoside hydrolase family 2 protein n=1 Tax=Pseudocolwellia sp. HL-MZ19 TaxID=3400846 RepID=UPI003CEDCEB7